ncbi:hypothetical protein BGW37DRAFT_302214 [Umbelopsis sp. PMI_123]|nr:hypothetical protein BGW37DRAFT_302214 [Umbelopsis sp. PMI_123]
MSSIGRAFNAFQKGNTLAHSTLSYRLFQSSAIVSAKKHPKQIRKENLAKRAAILAEYEKNKPSPVVAAPTPFYASLHTPETVSRSTDTYQHGLTAEDATLLFEKAPQAITDITKSSVVRSKEEALKTEQQKADIVKQIISLQNANAKAIQLWNVQRCIEWFGRKEGDTGSPEVQAAILSVRIQNLHSHLQQHKKDRHNYRQLRSMVHQRAKILKYLKSKSLTRYNTCLEQLGLQPRAVEGEIIV